MIGAGRAYLQTRNETASRERLMVLLFEAALRHTRMGTAAIEARRPADAVQALTRASDIVAELMATLDRKRAPELCDNLLGVYTFAAQRLMRAVVADDAGAAREAERVLAPVAEAFAEAVREVERQGTGAPR